MQLHQSVRHITRTLLAGSAFVLLATACGGGGDEGGAELASIADVENAGAGGGEDASGVIGGQTPDEVDAETAFLEYADCMRAEGLDFPDPTFDADGRIERGSFQVDRSQDGFEEADDACRGSLDGAALGGRGGAFRETFQAGLLDFTECIRDEGFAVDDVTLDEPGEPGEGGGPPVGGDGQDAPAPGGVQRDPGQAGDRLAGILGLDADDPEVAAAIEGCQPVLADALGDGPEGADDE